MSRSDRRWVTVLVLRTDQDAWARDRATTGAVLVRDVLDPPSASTDPVTGEEYPAGWAGCLVSPVPLPAGVCSALALVADQASRRRFGVRAMVATLAAGTVAEWRAQLPAVVAGVQAASVGWTAPEVIVLTRDSSATLTADLARAWPDARIVWMGPATAERPALAKLAEVRAIRLEHVAVLAEGVK